MFLIRNILFKIKVSEDECPEGKAIIAEAQIRAFPTFQFFMDGTKVDEMKGGNPSALGEMISKYVAQIPQSFAGSGFSLGGSTGGGNILVLYFQLIFR